MKHFRTPYAPGLSYVARVPFRFNGISFMPGNTFPGEKIDVETVSERRLRQMYDCRQIEVGTPSPPRFSAKPKPEEEKTDAAYSIEHMGFGRWTILGPGKSIVAEGLKKNEAQEQSIALNKPAGEREARAQGMAASAPPAPAPGPTTPAVV